MSSCRGCTTVLAMCDAAERGEGEFILSSPGFEPYYAIEVSRIRAALSENPTPPGERSD